MSVSLTKAKAILIISLIIICHVALTFYFLNNNRLGRQAEMRNKTLQKIVNIVLLVEATPIKNREKALKAIDDPEIAATLTTQPTFKKQFNQHNFWRVVHALESADNTVSLSIQLPTKKWLNITGVFYTKVIARQVIMMSIELLIVFAIFLVFWMTNRFSDPLKKISISTESLGIDTDIKPIDVYGPKAVQEVTLALNQMQNRIAELIRHRTQLLAGISHDLRTPIARAQLRTQFIEESEHKTQLLNDLNEMEKMIAETLAFAREQVKKEAKISIDLVSLLESICNDAQDLGHNVSLYSDQHRIAFQGRPLALKRAFTNVINNAIRYGESATVRIAQHKKTIEISVEDNGPGIPEEDLIAVFEPFYRSRHAKTKTNAGVGLGLSVVRDIVHAHQGEIILKNRLSRGLRVLIRL